MTRAWQERIGYQRDWVWRGWQIRYSFLPAMHESGPPLLLIHGFGAAIEHWRHNMPVLSQSHGVYAIDLLGFGGSRKAYTTYSIALWVAQIRDFVKLVVRRPVVLVGNSIGALVALTAADGESDWVKGIVMLSLLDVSSRQGQIPPWVQPFVFGLEKAIASPWLLKGLFQVLRRPAVIRRWAAIAYANAQMVNHELVAIIAGPPQDEGAARAFLALSKSVNQPRFSPAVKTILPTLNLPMLLVWGRQDRMIPSKLASVFAPLNARLELIELEQVGHCPHDECPERFNGLLLAWLANKFPSDGS